MARIRSVKPDICQHEVMAELSDGAERALVRLWTHADDDGRGVDNVKLIKAAVFPLNDEKTEDVLDELMDELEAAGFLQRYEVDGRRFFQVPNFVDHQKPRHKVDSKYPPPPSDYSPPANRRTPTASTPQTDGEVRDHVSPQSYGGPTAGGVRRGSGDGDGGGGATAARAPAHYRLLRSDKPPLFDEVDQDLAVLVDRHGADAVDRAVVSLLDRGLSYPFPSNIRKALEDELGEPPAVDTTPKCACGGRFMTGSGWVHTAGCVEVGATA